MLYIKIPSSFSTLIQANVFGYSKKKIAETLTANEVVLKRDEGKAGGRHDRGGRLAIRIYRDEQTKLV